MVNGMTCRYTNCNIAHVYYNKPSNKNWLFLSGDISINMGTDDALPYECIHTMLSSCIFDIVFIGDIFWPTGQNICRWCKDNNKVSVFLQHGQWIYTKNKMNPEFTPDYTFLFGENITREARKWPYASRSKILCTGSPRYDGIERNPRGSYIYFSPLVVTELSPSVPPKFNPRAMKLLTQLRGIDAHFNIVLQPHYREGSCDQIRSMFRFAKYIDPAEDPFPHIAGAYAVLCHRNSTVVLDAIAHGKKIVLINFQDYPSYYPKGYFCQFAMESDDYSQCLNNLCHVDFEEIEDYEEAARPYIWLGNASARIMGHLGADIVT